MPRHHSAEPVIIRESEPSLNMGAFTYEVAGEGDCQFGIDTESLYTLAVGPCIALAGINRATNYKLLGHFTGAKTEAFERAVENLDVLGEPEDTDIYLFGAAYSVKRGMGTKSGRLEAQARIFNYLSERDLSSGMLAVEWTEPGRTVDVAVANTGKISVHNYPRR